jgi:hypothetical protein
MLSLPDAARRLPTLANHCFIVAEGKRADVIWTKDDFNALCEHMLNENPPNHFLAVWIDKQGKPQWNKAPIRARADKRASWAYDTITGKAKVQTGIGFYPSNPKKESRWAAIDFDAHNGEFEPARKWSLEAFQLLMQHRAPELYLILCASGNGYHLFIYTREFYPVRQWILLLKQTCEWIGAPIAAGSCEIFPGEHALSQRTGNAIRAPGTWNPKTGKPSLIEAETVTGCFLPSLPRMRSVGVGKLPRVLPRNNTEVSLHREVNNYSYYYSLTTDKEIKNILSRHPIEQTGTRNGVLVKLIGELIYKFGRDAAQRIAEELYRLNQPNIRSTPEEHLSEFATAWESMRREILASLSPEERQKFDELKSEHQREGFLIVRAFAWLATQRGEKDFAISQASLADRLDISLTWAAKVIGRLCRLEVIAQTQPCVRHRTSARFRWLLPRSEAPKPATSETNSVFSSTMDALAHPLLYGQ